MKGVSEQIVWSALQDVKDPEIPTVSVVEMGMVNQVLLKGSQIQVEMTPTFVGCPALDVIRRDTQKRLMQLEGVTDVQVSFVIDPPWTSERITPEGRKKLTEFGIAPPKMNGQGSLDIVPPCPYCGAEGGEVHNLFGPTACRSIFYCRKCRQPFEGMKPI